MRRTLVSIGLVGLFAIWWSRPEPEVHTPSARPAPSKQVTRFLPARDLEPVPVRTVDPARFQQQADRVADDCGLPLRTVCEAEGCAAVFEAPDLDGFLGWATMTTHHPWFVLNVVGRDLGWSSTPCASALTSAFDEGIRAWEPPGRSEVWCSVRPEHPTTDANALCDRVASRVLGLHDADFAASTRRLSFAP